MGNAFEQRHEHNPFEPAPSQPLVSNDAPPVGGPAMTDTSRFDPKDPVHAQLWAHMVGDHEVVGRAAPDGVWSPLAAGLPGLGEKNLAEVTDVAFNAGDWALAHGGQALLDIGGFIPGVNVVTEGGQAAYHAMHAMNDHNRGDDAHAKEEAVEAAWHGTSALIDVATLEGGNEVNASHKAVHVAHEGMRALEIAHGVHTAVDGAELAWDTTSTLVRALGGTKEQLPFFGGLVPWLANGAGKDHDK